MSSVKSVLQGSVEGVSRLVDSLPVLIAYVDTDLRYGYANAAYLDWVKHTPEELLGRPIADILGKEFFTKVRPFAEQALRGEGVAFESL